MSHITDLDKRYLWHPFTQMADWQKTDPLVITHAKGCEVFDEDGNAYLDGSASIWVNLHGHRKGKIDRAIKRQLDKVAHTTFLGLTNPPAAMLAQQLVERTPEGLSRVFYSDNGSTAVEVALKMAFQFWRQSREEFSPGRNKFVSFDHAYHGDTIGAVSVGGIDLFHTTFKAMLFPGYHVPFPYCYRCPMGLQKDSCAMECLEPVEATLKTYRENIAGLVVEPLVQGASGILTMPEGYLKRLETLCRRYGTLLIVDEVATGFGRTGKMFACEHEDVTPDLLCLSKGITGGYMPLAATLATERIYDAFLGDYDEFRTFFHGHSYTGNPLGCAAALANLEIFDDEQVLKKIQPRIKHLWKTVRRELGDHPNVGDIRGRGLMIGIELVKDRATKAAFPMEAQIGNRIAQEIRKQGVLIRPIGSVIVLIPPLAMSKPQLTRLVKATHQALNTVLDTGGRTAPLETRADHP